MLSLHRHQEEVTTSLHSTTYIQLHALSTKENCILSQHSTFPAVFARTGSDPRQVPGVHAMQQAACLVQDGAQLAGDAGAEEQLSSNSCSSAACMPIIVIIHM